MDMRSLNTAQRRAVESTEGPLLVLAGAGTGKTRVVTYRIARLLENGVPPSAILAVTFTNKAATEMRERVRAIVPSAELSGIVISTFHSLGARMLRADIEKLGGRSPFSIYDESDQLSLLRGVLRDLKLGEIEAPIKRIRFLLSDAKNRLAEPSDTAASLALRRYDEALRSRNAVDFDDLVRLPVTLLERHDEVRAAYQERFHYLLVDEYQDTNAAQYRLVKLLAGKRRNVCVVGDDDQSIYGWRGAEVAKILRFERDFPGASVVTLEENYRSTATILAAANSLILRNIGRRDKRLRSSLGPGEPVDLYVGIDEIDEAEFVARRVEAVVRGHEAPLSEIAILYRQNSQSKLFEDALRERRIPYRVFGGLSFYDRKEIRDCIAYLKLIHNTSDEISLRRIVNDPPRGIGAATLERIDAHGLEHGLTLFAALADARAIPDLRPQAVEAALAFHALIDGLRSLARPGASGRPAGPTRVIDSLLEAVPMRAAIEMSCEDPLEAEARWREIEELRNAAARHEARHPGARLEGFLEELTLLTEEREDGADSRDSVRLMTLHAATGLEFEVVFVVGLEDGVLPHRRSTEPQGDALDDGVDEERRLLYVGITRARRRVTLTRAAARTQKRRLVECAPSRFLAEVDRACLRSVSRIQTPASPEQARRRLREIVEHLESRRPAPDEAPGRPLG